MVNESKKNDESLFLSSLYNIMKVSNELEEFRIRLIDGQAVLYDLISIGCTILNDDESFGFAYFPYTSGKDEFIAKGKKIIENQKREKIFIPKSNDNGIIYCSVIPWIPFTSFKHATTSVADHSIPRIVMGKIHQKDGVYYMPLSVEVHHALMDGLHVGRFYNKMEKLCNADEL